MMDVSPAGRGGTPDEVETVAASLMGHDDAFITALAEVANALGATPMQVALAWLLQRAPNLLLIPGTSSVGHLHENIAAVDLTLSNEAVATLERIAAGA